MRIIGYNNGNVAIVVKPPITAKIGRWSVWYVHPGSIVNGKATLEEFYDESLHESSAMAIAEALVWQQNGYLA